jgi:glucosamine--fructose-6-phosphate aminotransferase (isomerizing)
MLPNQPPELITDQLKTLSTIHREDFRAIDASVRSAFTALEIESVHRVYATGDGDSYHAALSAEMAFNEFAKIPYSPISAMRFLEYGADYIPVNFPRDTIVVGISASGGSQRVVQALNRTKSVSEKITVAGLVGKVDSPLAREANTVISAQIPELGRSPGIRTYTASLMGLIDLAIRIGEIKRHYHMSEADAFRREIIEMADMVDATYQAAIEPAEQAAEMTKSAPFFSYTGSGPSFGSAYFSSAKVVEAASIFAVAQDLEEWAHVERFAYPLDFPTFIIAPPGKGYWRALDLAKGVKLLGHPLMAVIDENDKEISKLADVVFPVKGQVREAFSPLLYYISGTYFAYALTKKLGRSLFMTDNEFVMNIREEMRRQIQG